MSAWHKADMTAHPGEYPLSGVKRIWRLHREMSANDQSGHLLSLALKSFPPHWLTPRVCVCKMKFRSIRTSWEGKFPVFIALAAYYYYARWAAKISQLGSSSSPVTQARIVLIEMEREKGLTHGPDRHSPPSRKVAGCFRDPFYT
jgi:hypothetical protein